MNRFILYLSFITMPFFLYARSIKDPVVLGTGTQPQIGLDGKGIIRIVFGRNDSIFCATSTNHGNSFSEAVLVGIVKGMHLGMSRGPQIASSSHTSVITAMDKAGDIHFFQLDHNNGKWKNNGYVNDLRLSAPEGLMGLTADNRDHFYAVWLDIRQGKKNNIYFSSMNLSQNRWSKNAMVYQSPDGHVCECCKPNIAVKNNKVAIMFRNWLNGSRDLYLAESINAGGSFTPAQKLGNGTWPLNGCPMDGGGLVIDNKGNVQTTWQRQGVVYICKPGEPEIELVKGRGCTISLDPKSDKWLVAYQEGDRAKLINSAGKEWLSEYGSFLRPLVLVNGTIVCVWESNKKILYHSQY